MDTKYSTVLAMLLGCHVWLTALPGESAQQAPRRPPQPCLTCPAPTRPISSVLDDPNAPTPASTTPQPSLEEEEPPPPPPPPQDTPLPHRRAQHLYEGIAAVFFIFFLGFEGYRRHTYSRPHR